MAKVILVLSKNGVFIKEIDQPGVNKLFNSLRQRFPNFFVRGTLQDNFSENGTPLKQTNNR